jgi:O-antigen/teichoic acid export membrane protein
MTISETFLSVCQQLLPPRLQAVSGRVRRASLTTILNGSLSGVRSLFSFFTISMLVGYLGKDSYGLCLTITGMVTWLAVTQGGLGQSLRNELIRTRALSGDSDAPTRLFSSAFVFLLFLTLIVGILLTAIAWFLPWRTILNYPGFDSDPRYFRLILSSLWIILLTVPLSMVRAAYSAFQLEYKLSPFLLAGLLTAFGATAFAVRNNIGETTAMAASLTANLIGLALGASFMPQLLGVRFSWREARMSDLRGLQKVGAWFFVIEVSMILIFQVDVFLINLLRGQSDAAVFALHSQLFVYIQAPVALLISPYCSAFGEAWHSGDKAWLRSWVRRLSIGTAGLTFFGVVIVILLGHAVMPRWSHGQVAWNASLALALGANVIMQSVTSVPAAALGSLGLAREQALVIIVQAIMNALACYWFIHLFGIIGAALASFITYSLTSAWYVPFKLRSVAWARQHCDPDPTVMRTTG